ncbi:PilN domain-containing protein [Geomonas subterranea]|uniref:PilN domain-containing protein n=1 Tax=Geomonas subterranea TaxID=2847989 RepID=A0ABX8LGL4_9BACT|nr:MULTISPECIES: PilN domain-containing protein [Geomonas]QXE91117.1 PilN domain-containing protein [Geomonas subterranea]QXM10796.1 PilN domain-containing protein [Geomonas subterranea]
MKLTINLATRRYVNLRQLNAVLAASFIVVALLLVYLVRVVANNQVEINKIKGQSAAASRGPAGAAPVPAEQMKALEWNIAFANTLIDRKSTNWLALLDKLELVVPPGVALTQVEPSLEDPQALKLGGVALTFENLRSLVENMEQSPNFSEVYLLGQSEHKVGKTQRGYGFTLSCKVGKR